MDEYKEYMKDGEISYTGKIDSVKAFSGRDRVLITGIFKADPKVSELRIYWDTRSDSLSIPITRTEGIDTVSVYVPIPEGPHSFELVTFDKIGNKSITVNATGTSYGARYIANIINRPITSAELDANTNAVTLNWGGIDLTGGVIATEVVYTDVSNKTVTIIDSIDGHTTTPLPNYKTGTTLKYRTAYLPDASSIDTFFVNYANVTPNVTYFRNLGYPFTRASWDGSRWGVLANWITNAQIKNAGSNTYGGYELRGGAGVMSLEGGWGLRAVTNGKIYQSTTLPAGSYSLEATGIDAGATGEATRFFAVVRGDVMPDIADIGTSIVYKPIPAATGAGRVKLEFVLTETTRVTIGISATVPDTGSYCKITGITFLKL